MAVLTADLTRMSRRIGRSACEGRLSITESRQVIKNDVKFYTK